ncbi:2-methylisocitrate lyase-like PEP mutase family enzyme [Rhizobium petrolearium]|uniref:isocitrate lyase/PEP mutase family protein n=1 Tax=Neorhizobium petrolearium TaxID=515361 RepID=UPI001AE55D4D|nr:isocitrate lyase/PEP mutase family protein [Neorhizobium petrolearium]MBP1845644.1 2-methylisocitrate lyase-like PEP mutase family enzyme [Neorhizobium petrolearium]
MNKNALTLRTLLSSGEIVAAPGAPDCFTARLVARAGFPAVYMTGFGATAMRLGQPDIGLLTLSEMAEHARNMVRAVDIPVIADADTGYGGISNIKRTVEEYTQARVAALHLEDQVAPKRCGQLAGIKLIDPIEASLRLKAAVEAKGKDPLLMIGRTDALPALGAAEAIDRAKRYQDAGVDLVFVDGIKTIAEVEAVARGLEGPKVVSIVDGNETTGLSREDLQAMGFSMVFYAVTTLFAAARAAADALTHLKAAGTPAGGPASMSYADFSGVVGLADHQALGDRFGS